MHSFVMCLFRHKVVTFFIEAQCSCRRPSSSGLASWHDVSMWFIIGKIVRSVNKQCLWPIRPVCQQSWWQGLLLHRNNHFFASDGCNYREYSLCL